MKSKIFKFSVPTLMFILAIFSAYAFKSVESKSRFAPETGWVNLPSNPCVITDAECDNNPNLTEICTIIYQGNMHQVFGKVSDNPLDCTRTLYKIPD